MKKLMLTAYIALATLSTQTAFAESKTILTNAEKEQLILMREEEKLARDVYITLGNKYSINVFKNIPKAEGRHMEAVGSLLQNYGLPDPVKDDTVGVFTSPGMEAFYKELVAAVDNELAALKVGAEIEDLDIADLMKAMDDTEKPDLDNAYSNLLRGSENHLRAFMRQIDRLGGTYTPKHLSQAQFDKIIKSDQEKSKGQNNGKGQGNGQGQKTKNKKQ